MNKIPVKLDIYREIAIGQVPRILGFGDRDPDLVTYGCFDRHYWHYKFHDFSNARFQETALLLALIYKYDFIDNVFFNQSRVLEWCKGAIKFWLKIQKSNGSFDEAYPYENSFVATAFSTYAITEAVLQLNLDILPLKKIKKTGNWLCENNNMDVANQMAGAIVSLYNIFLISGDNRYKYEAEEKLESLLKLQTKEGYFPEYGGYDIGYLSICIDYLAKYLKKSKDKKARKMLLKAVEFMEKFIDDDGYYDNKNTSRNTQYIYPKGLSYIESSIIEKHINGLKGNKIVNPQWMDDRFSLPLTINYLETYLGC